MGYVKKAKTLNEVAIYFKLDIVADLQICNAYYLFGLIRYFLKIDLGGSFILLTINFDDSFDNIDRGNPSSKTRCLRYVQWRRN